MSALQPETRHALGVMLRELEQTIIPDLASAHAKTVAHLIGRSLRNLLTREEAVAALLDDWNRSNVELLRDAGRECPALPDDRVDRNVALGQRVETLIAERMVTPGAADNVDNAGHATKGEPDAMCRKAISAEREFFTRHAQAIDAMTIPQRTAARRDLLAMTPQRLTEYFARKLPRFKTVAVTGVTPILSGFSKETLLVDIEADGVPMPLVIRCNVPFGAVDTSVVDEYPVVCALHRQGLPVPEPVLLEVDASEFGEAFSVTRRARGAAATNGMSGLVAGPELTAAAYELATFLARLHSVELDTLDLPIGFYDPALTTRDYLLREIDICERYYRNHRRQPSPVITASIAWLRAHVPHVEAPPRMVHGDASLSNIMIDDNKISVMLDWELAHPGDPVEDVTYTRKWIDQFMSWDDFLAHYYRHGGPQYHPEREKFYAMLSDLRVAVFAVRTQDMMHKTDHPELTQMYAAQHYYGYFVGNVAKGLLGD